MSEFLQLDFAALLAAALAGGTCGLLGSFLLLRRESMLGDALAHSVLPGIVAAYALTGLRSAWPMLLGALAAGLLAAAAITWVRRAARMEPGAATGLVFTGFFAVGLVLLEVTGIRALHFHVEAVLFGQLETLVWLEAEGVASLLDPAALAALPSQIGLLAGVALGAGLFVTLCWRPLKLIAFDPDYGRSLGMRPGGWELALNAAIGAAAVAAFQAVGTILVVALLICPAVALRLLTDRYAAQLLGGAALGAGLGVLGVLLAGPLPAWLGQEMSFNAAGVIGSLGGLAVACAAWWRARRISAAAASGGVAPPAAAPPSRPR